MKLGISTYTYAWAIGVPGMVPEKPMDCMGLLEKAESLDIGLIQVADNLPLDRMKNDDLLELYREANEADIRLEAGARVMTDSNLEKYIGIAELIHSPLLRFVVDGPDYAPPPEDILAIIKNALPVLQDKEIILAIENYERLKARDYADLVEKAGSEHVGICLDSVNSLGAGEGLETVVDLLGPLTVNLHVKEFTIKRISHKMGFRIEGLPAGEGMLNLPWLLQHVSARCKTAILEQWTPPEQSLEETIRKEAAWSEMSISYLKSIFKN